MKSIVFSGLIALATLGAATAAEASQCEPPRSHAHRHHCRGCKAEYEERDHSLGHKALLYFPNRIFDVIDFVRVRVRVGPGFAVGARVTKLTDVFFGSYVSAYAGLPGPRQCPMVPLPVGLESRSGVAVSVVDATASICATDPCYSLTESGAGFHIIIVGLELGVDPLEILDLLAGFAMFDPVGDDL
jgi:hypothetical protein